MLKNQNTAEILRIEHLNKDYGNRAILRDINLKLNSGDFIYLIGNNGSGKSTLLNLIRHEDVPDDGIIQVGTFRLDKLKKKNVPYYRRMVGYVRQDDQLIPHVTVKRNLTYPLEALGYPNSVIKQRYEDALAIVGIYDRRNEITDTLSSGERQLVSIAQALINKPEILLVDEPTSNLSPALSDKMFAALDKISAMNTTVIDVTHNDEQLEKYPHPTYWLHNKTLQRATY